MKKYKHKKAAAAILLGLVTLVVVSIWQLYYATRVTDISIWVMILLYCIFMFFYLFVDDNKNEHSK